MSAASGDPASVSVEHHRIAVHSARLAAMPQVYRRLRNSSSAADLFAAASEAAREHCGFSRALVLVVGNGALTADDSDPLSDPESDRLRRRVQAAPVMLAPGTLETEIVRGAGPRRAQRRSLLAESLDLQNYEIAPIASTSQPLALLVVDRPDEPVDMLDQAVVANLATIVGVAFEHLVLHARVAEVSAELRHLTTSTQALMTEVLHAPVTVPAAHPGGSTFPPSKPQLGATGGLLTEREEQVAALLVDGRSNREIAEQLMVSPETIKDYVTRVRRKLHAANRAEAAARYMRLTQSN